MIKNLLRIDVDPRPPNLIRAHYETEKALANKLRTATRNERRLLYTSVYDELFQRVPHHPQIARKGDETATAIEVSRKMRLVGRYLKPTTQYLEVGPGDCHFAFEVAKHVQRVVAIDVSAEIVQHRERPRNFELVISDGCTIPVPTGSITLVYSNQLMEHLHPDDAQTQLENIYAALATGGIYICITPNRYSGPHDVSQHFDDVATGLHLREYSYSELCVLFKRVGFGHLTAYIGGRGVYLRFPVPLLRLCESLIGLLPRSLCRRLARSAAGRALLGINLVAVKS